MILSSIYCSFLLGNTIPFIESDCVIDCTLGHVVLKGESVKIIPRLTFRHSFFVAAARSHSIKGYFGLISLIFLKLIHFILPCLSLLFWLVVIKRYSKYIQDKCFYVLVVLFV